MNTVIAGKSLAAWQCLCPAIGDLVALWEMQWVNSATVPAAQTPPGVDLIVTDTNATDDHAEGVGPNLRQ